VGRGTFVNAAGSQAREAPFAWQGKVALGAQRTLDPTMRGLVREQGNGAISFAAGASAVDRFPVALFRDLFNQVLERELGAALGLGPTEGQPRLREALATRMKVRPGQVLTLAGSQQGLDLIARSLLDPGDVVVIDRPGYLGAIQIFRAAGAHLVGWDATRADPDELEELLQRYRPKLLYTNPTFHNPTGRTLSLDVRQAILALAARYRLPVIEDEPYRELTIRPATLPPTLLELDAHGLVIHLSTFSKTLAAGLRLGWLVAPEAVIDQLALVKQRSDLFGAGAMQLIVAEMLARGSYDAHLRMLRIEHARRHEAMISALERLPPGALSWSAVAGGLYLWVCARHDVDTRLLAQRAQAAGVAILCGEAFYPDSAGWHEIRLCFARNPPDQIALGVGRLARVLTEDEGIRVRSGATHPVM